MIIILFPFVHYLTKFFGIYAVLFPFLVIITLGTWFFELSCFLFWNGGMVDLTKYDATDKVTLYIDYHDKKIEVKLMKVGEE